MAPLVLIVDDNHRLRRAVTQMLRARGYQTLEAATGHEAIKKTTSSQPNLVLMDIDLPDMTGAEATRAIKTNPTTAKIPILGWSAYLGSEFRDAALASGMVEYLVKPISLERIAGKITECLQHQT